MNQESLQLFKTLTEMSAAPGFEKEIRKFVRKELLKSTDEIVQDRLGGIFGVKRGDAEGPKVMVAGHMDEVGFMVTGVTDNGMIRFQPLGGWWNQVLLSMRVHIQTKQDLIVGVVGSTPPHLMNEAQRKVPVEIEGMYIDIGADDCDDVHRMGVRPGQQIIPTCPFTPMANPKKIMAKAWDNRYGVGLAIELLKEMKDEQLPNTLYSGATVQEELGLRGAETAARLIEPDICYVLDASPANDMSGDKNSFGQLGKGALLRIYDRTMLTHRGMVDFLVDTAETHDIPYQYYISAGGTDAGRIHLSGIGVPTAVVGICSRYIHTAASIIHIDDYAAAKELLIQLVKSTNKTTLDTLNQG
jgi:putative aminopeptidase FrvX